MDTLSELIGLAGDPWATNAARTQARAPTREAQLGALMASQAPTLSAWGRLGSNALSRLMGMPEAALQSAAAMREGYGYDPEPVLGLAGMMVGSPLTPRGALGSGMQRIAGAPERLERAAIRIGDQTYAGANHGIAFENASKVLGRPVEDLIDAHYGAPGVDGFLTSRGRFVSREEAAKLAEASKLHSIYQGEAPSSLISEDLKNGALWGLLGLGGAEAATTGMDSRRNAQ